jgi:F-type H+-transporting ATPase subunit alpha
MVELLKQPQYQPLPVEEQTMMIWVATNGFLDDLPVTAIRQFETDFYGFMRSKYPQVGKEIRERKELTDAVVGQLKKATEEFKPMFSVK